ncbi:MAG TPA: ABC transporter permease, partial [Bryobacteraceae bacterium]|nr:ABC transporter permease [Bryobacteraceae bacterium]
DCVLLKSLPYPHPERIVNVWEKPPGYDRNGISTLNFLDWQRENTVFTAMAAMTGGSYTLTGAKEPVQLRGSRVSAPYFDILGIRPAMGRTFAKGEDQPGKDQVVVLSHRLWESRFGSDPRLIGKTILLNNLPYTVIGVMPANTAFDRQYNDLWTPLAFQAQDMTRDFHWMMSWARLKPGVTLEQARDQMKTIAARIAQAYPKSNKGWSATVDRYEDRFVNDHLRRSLWVLLAAVGAVMLIACVNLANLLLVRGASREREVGIRVSVGASRWQVLRQFLTESILLSVLGGCAGILLGYGLTRLLKNVLPQHFLPAEASVTVDFRVLLFTAALIVLTGILFGLAPALQASRTKPVDSLRDCGRSATTSASGMKLRSALIVVEVSLAFVLVSCAGLLIRSFYALEQVDTGFNSTNVVTMYLPMDAKQFVDPTKIINYHREMLEQIRAVPGVLNAANTTALPLQGWGYGMPFQIAGQPVKDVANRPGCFFKMVSPSYFQTLDMRLRKGRGLTESDSAGSAPVAVINQTMVKKYFKNEDPIGKRILVEQIIPAKHALGPEIPWQVVGVVADEKVGDLDDSSAGMYVTIAQSPTTDSGGLVVRAAMDPDKLIKAVQAAIWGVNKNQAISDIKTLEQIKTESLGGNKLRTYLLMSFAGLALLLAAVGLYGVISYTAAQRTHELGLRSALGASRFDLLRLMMRGGLALTGVGLVIGILGTLAVGRLLASLLFDVKPGDPLSLIVAGAILAAVAALASFIPALSAAQADPMTALRYE